MTPYERGYAAGLKAAAELCNMTANILPPGPFTGLCAETLQSAEQRILSLPIVGEATNPGEQECVMVPREPKKGLLCGDVAISTDPRYAGWVFVRHVDGINWTTGAKLTPETWAMLAAAKEEHSQHLRNEGLRISAESVDAVDREEHDAHR